MTKSASTIIQFSQWRKKQALPESEWSWFRTPIFESAKIYFSYSQKRFPEGQTHFLTNLMNFKIYAECRYFGHVQILWRAINWVSAPFQRHESSDESCGFSNYRKIALQDFLQILDKKLYYTFKVKILNVEPWLPQTKYFIIYRGPSLRQEQILLV